METNKTIENEKVDKNDDTRHQRRGMGKDIGGMSNMQKRFAETEKEKFPGAYKPDQLVLALDRECKQWMLAEIYKVRLSKFFDEEEEE